MNNSKNLNLIVNINWRSGQRTCSIFRDSTSIYFVLVRIWFRWTLLSSCVTSQIEYRIAKVSVILLPMQWLTIIRFSCDSNRLLCSIIFCAPMKWNIHQWNVKSLAHWENISLCFCQFFTFCSIVHRVHRQWIQFDRFLPCTEILFE